MLAQEAAYMWAPVNLKQPAYLIPISKFNRALDDQIRISMQMQILQVKFLEIRL
jgi:hypothetical protein